MLHIPYATRYQIGLDLSSAEGRAVLISKKARHHVCQLIDIPHFDTTHTDTFFKNLRTTIPSRARHIVIGLGSHTLMQHHIALEAPLTDKEIHQYLQESLEKIFNEPLQNLYFDWEKFHSILEQGASSVRVMAVKRTLLNPILHACQNHRLALRAVEVDAYANARLVTPTSERIAVLTLHPHHLSLLVRQEQNIIHLAHNALSNPCIPLTHAIENILQQFDAKHPHCTLNQLFLCNYHPGESTETLIVQIQTITQIKTLTLDSAMTIAATLASSHITACALGLRGLLP